MSIIEGKYYFFEPFLGLKMHHLNCNNLIMGDKVEIIRKTRKGTYIGRVVRTSEEMGGFIKKDFKTKEDSKISSDIGGYFKMAKNLTGTSLAGGSVNHERAANDFYTTDPQSVRDFLEVADIKGEHFYEPCVGQGHIADVLKEHFKTSKVLGTDLVDRGYPNTIVRDFINDDFDVGTNWVITNPPFKYAREFIDKSLEIADVGVAMFLKIQFLESQARKEWLKKSPLKYVYVFSKRQAPWNNGRSLNPTTGKKWSNTMCFTWFVWEHGYEGEPIIRWI